MRIHEVEHIVGITGKNIRFYEEQGLLTPQRNKSNGYREYGEAEIAALQQIKLLRKLGVPIEEIRNMQQGHHTVADGMRRHLVTLERDRQNMDRAIELCTAIKGYDIRLADLEAGQILERIRALEEEGTTFVDKQRLDTRRSRYAAPVLISAMVTLLMVSLIWLLIRLFRLESGNMPPVAVMIVLIAIPIMLIAGILFAAAQRLREIKKGEMDDARRY